METAKPLAKRCPKCGLPSPSRAAKCRCGHDFFAAPASPVPAATAPTEPKTLEDYKKLFTRQNAPGGIIGGLSGLAGGLIGIYSGLNLLIPLVGAMAAIWIAQRVLTGPSKHFAQAIGVQTGHILWFMAGLIVAGTSMVGQIAFDVIGMVGLMAWLVARPGPWPVRALLTWQALAVAVNLLLLWPAKYGSVEHRAMVAHLAIRAASIYYLVDGLRQLRKSQEVMPVDPFFVS